MGNAKPNRFFSKKQEDRGSAYLGMKPTANSGATDIDKGDSKDKHMLAEFKTMTKPQKSITLQKEYFDKIEEEAIAKGKTFGAVVFDFGDQKNMFVAVRMQDFRQLYESWKREVEG